MAETSRHKQATRIYSYNVLLTDNGSSLLELAIVMPVLLLMVIGAVDIGREYDMALTVASAATAGAVYGTFRPTDILGMQSAAMLDANNLTGLVPLAIWGCECSDGSSTTPLCTVTPSCTTNVVRYVQVTTTLTYVPIFAWPGIPSPVVLQAKSVMRAGM